MSSDNIVEAVLRLITEKSRTSRDIQITLGKEPGAYITDYEKDVR